MDSVPVPGSVNAQRIQVYLPKACALEDSNFRRTVVDQLLDDLTPLTPAISPRIIKGTGAQELLFLSLYIKLDTSRSLPSLQGLQSLHTAQMGLPALRGMHNRGLITAMHLRTLTPPATNTPDAQLQ